MLFNSFSFAIFLPVVFILYWALPHRFRWIVLFVSSYYFYMSWNIKYVLLILFTTAVSYFSAKMMENAGKKRKKQILAVTLIASLGVLFFFKYFNFASSSVCDFLGLFAIRLNPLTLQLLLPVGISFYTFQTLSYVIDVYRGDAKAERHFGIYATFISFFPQLVAGPIERTNNLLPQIRVKHTFDYSKASYGLRLMAWGFLKKMVIADTMSIYVDKVYQALPANSGFALVGATILFAIQIYCDFSGYSDIAIGTARLFGINLMQNFKSPYFSSSVKEFWSRWHISLSTWLKDYIYIPLGGNRTGKIRHYLNLMITFLISGLWHGANWTFVIWGGLHGLAQITENMLYGKERKQKNGLLYAVHVLLVFIFCCFAWIFFRAQSLSEAIYVICHSLDGITSPVSYIYSGLLQMGFGLESLISCIFLIIVLAVYDFLSLKQDVIEKVGKMPNWLRWLLYLSITWGIIAMTPVLSTYEFIYFQF